MKKYLLFIMLLISPIFVCAYNMQGESYFYKIDEDENLISDAEFVFRDLNNKVNYEVYSLENNQGYKYIGRKEDTYDKLVNFVPSNVLEIINNFHNGEDILPYIYDNSLLFRSIKAECLNNLADSNNSYTSSIKRMHTNFDYDKCIVTIPSVAFIEETKTPKGLEKETIVLPIYLEFQYFFDEATNDITDITGTLYNYSRNNYFDSNNEEHVLYEMYKYDDSLDYNDIETVFNTITRYDDNMLYRRTGECTGRSINGMNSATDKYRIKRLFSEEVTFNCDTVIVVDKKGTSNLSISSYVNSEEEIDIEETSTVQIKVHLKNDGKAPSYDNVIVSKVPAGVEYVSGSATDNGVYSEEDKTVTWNFAYLDAKDGYMFAYDVVVPTGSKSSVYVTTSSVSAEDTNTPIESNEARVTTGTSSNEIVNPKTGDTRTIVSLIILTISVGLLSYFFTKKSMTL